MSEAQGPIFNQLLELTGLPEELVRTELENLLMGLGQDADTLHRLTLDELRGALVHYLESIDAELGAGADDGSDVGTNH